MFVAHGEKNIRHGYKSKYNLKRENQVILLKINAGEKWHYLEMSEEDTFIKYNDGVKSMRDPFVIYADLESLLTKMNTCINDPNKSSTTRIISMKCVVIH